MKAARIRTIGLGGDSRITFGPGGRLTVGPTRVVPLSYLGAKYPTVEKALLELKKKPLLDWRSTDLDYWFLHQNPGGHRSSISAVSRSGLLELLSQGPLCLTEILETLGLYHPMQLHAESLIRQGLIEQSTLTPTDLLHVTGQFTPWSRESAQAAFDFACTLFERKKETLVEEVLDLMTATIVEEVVAFLGQKKDRGLPGKVRDPWGKWFLQHSLKRKNPYLDVTIASRIPIIGIGAPAAILLKNVAASLMAPLFLPPHASVANAVGAVAGSVMVVKEALVYAQETERVQRFFVQGEGERSGFVEAEGALSYAQGIVEKEASAAAILAGAVNPQVLVDVFREGAYFRVVAKALGNPRLSW